MTQDRLLSLAAERGYAVWPNDPGELEWFVLDMATTHAGPIEGPCGTFSIDAAVEHILECSG